MKKSFFKKIMLAFTAFAGVFVMASCQTTEKNASFPTSECSVSIVDEVRDGKTKHYADVVLCVKNNTIYNIDEIEYNYVVSFDGAKPDITVQREKASGFVLRHGVTGYIGYRLEIPEKSEFEGAKKVTINHIDVTHYQSVWQTYMAAFIVAICMASLSVLFFAISLFRRGLSKAELKEMFVEHLAGELTVFGLVLIICLIPLMFSSWVTTVVLLGGFGASILVTGLMTLLRLRFSNN